jgi:hypothetical protein
MSDHLNLKRFLPPRQFHLALLLIASLSSTSMAAEIEFRSNPSGFEVAVAEGLEWYFLESASQGETNFNQAGAEQRCAKAGDSTSPGLRLPTETEVRALASAGTHRYNYVLWTSTPGVGRTTMEGFADKRYTFPDPLNMKLRLMCVRRARIAPVSIENQVGNRGVAAVVSTPSANVPVQAKPTAVVPGRWEPSLTEKTYSLGPVRTINRQGEPTTTFSYISTFSAGRYEAATEQEAIEKVLNFQRKVIEIRNSYDLAVETLHEGPIECRVLKKGSVPLAHSCYREGKLRVTTLKISDAVTDKTGWITVHHPNGESYRTSVYRGKVDIDETRANRKVVKESAPAVTAQPAGSTLPSPIAQATAVAPEPKPLIGATAQAGPALMLEQQRLIDQLDQMDKMDLQTELDRAQACTTRRDFPCSEKSLAKAARYAKGTRDKAAVAQAQKSLQAEVELVREEESQRVARLERQRRDDERAKRDQRDVEAAAERMAERRENEAARSAALASVIGALARPQQPQDWLQAETRATLARTNQLLAQANREQAAVAATQQAAADRAVRQRLAARQEALAAAEQRASLEAAQARREQEFERDRERQQRLAAQTASSRVAQGAQGNTISQIAPPGPPVIAYPTRCPPGYVPSDGTVMPMSSPREGICIRQNSTTNASTAGSTGGAAAGAGGGAGTRNDTGTAAPNAGTQSNTGSRDSPAPVVVAGGGSQPRPGGNSPGGGSNWVPPTAPPPTPVSPTRPNKETLNDICMSHSSQIPYRMTVCYAESMRQYYCKKIRNEVGLGFIQTLSLRSSLKDKDSCFHVDYSNERPARENLLE